MGYYPYSNFFPYPFPTSIENSIPVSKIHLYLTWQYCKCTYWCTVRTQKRDYCTARMQKYYYCLPYVCRYHPFHTTRFGVIARAPILIAQKNVYPTSGDHPYSKLIMVQLSNLHVEMTAEWLPEVSTSVSHRHRHLRRHDFTWNKTVDLALGSLRTFKTQSRFWKGRQDADVVWSGGWVPLHASSTKIRCFIFIIAMHFRILFSVSFSNIDHIQSCIKIDMVIRSYSHRIFLCSLYSHCANTATKYFSMALK